MVDAKLRKLIPDSLAPLADRSVGLALRFAERFGGRRINIPKNLTGKSPLAAALGREDAQVVIDALGGGCDLTVPLCARALIHQRNSKIEERARAGASVNTLVTEFGIHEVTVRKILRAMRERRRRVVVMPHRSGE